MARKRRTAREMVPENFLMAFADSFEEDGIQWRMTRRPSGMFFRACCARRTSIDSVQTQATRS